MFAIQVLLTFDILKPLHFVDGNKAKRVYSTDKILFIRGQHASMINGLQGRYPVFGPVVR